MKKWSALLLFPLSCSAPAEDLVHEDEEAVAQVKQALTSNQCFTVTYERDWQLSNPTMYPDTNRFLSNAELSGTHPLTGAKANLYCSASNTHHSEYLNESGTACLNLPVGESCSFTVVGQLDDRTDSGVSNKGFYIASESFPDNPRGAAVPSLNLVVPPTPGHRSGHISKAYASHWVANAIGFFDVLVNRLRDDYDFDSLYKFEAGVAALSAKTDHDPLLYCGYGGAPPFCCPFDPGQALNVGICAHEFSHSVERQVAVARNKAPFPFPANTEEYPSSCTGYYGSPLSQVTEAMANFMPYALLYETPEDIGALEMLDCYPGDRDNDCNDCGLFSPSSSSYPVSSNPAQACPIGTENGADGNWINWNECRALRMFINLVDNDGSAGLGCLPDTASVPFKAVFDRMTNFIYGNGESHLPRPPSFQGDHDNDKSGNAVYSNELVTLMDVVNSVVPTSSAKYSLWANACYAPAEIASTFVNNKTPVAIP